MRADAVREVVHGRAERGTQRGAGQTDLALFLVHMTEVVHFVE